MFLCNGSHYLRREKGKKYLKKAVLKNALQGGVGPIVVQFLKELVQFLKEQFEFLKEQFEFLKEEPEKSAIFRETLELCTLFTEVDYDRSLTTEVLPILLDLLRRPPCESLEEIML